MSTQIKQEYTKMQEEKHKKLNGNDNTANEI